MSKNKKGKTPKMHKDLEGFEIHINEFGEIKSSFSIDRLNDFLNENVDDKKLREKEGEEEEEQAED